jgi:FtsZ-binding cell division protein ZapB
MSDSESEIKKAAEALKRENEQLEAEKIKQEKEIADLLKKIKKA